jgi:glycine cleavage system H protein
MVQKGLLYTKEHEWAKIEGKTAIVGITDYAQQMLGELTFVELPAVGRQVEARDAVATVESSKAASDVYSPVAGKVCEVNIQLHAKPELINTNCFSAGWICKIEISGADAAKGLMDAAQYEQYLKEL